MTGRAEKFELIDCERFPDEILPGKFYFSEDFRSSIHLCACGCGSKVVLPIKPAGWDLIQSGRSFTLLPSVGNREFLCRSHYLIEDGAIIWLPAMSDREVMYSRHRDQRHIQGAHSISFMQRLRNIVRWITDR